MWRNNPCISECVSLRWWWNSRFDVVGRSDWKNMCMWRQRSDRVVSSRYYWNHVYDRDWSFSDCHYNGAIIRSGYTTCWTSELGICIKCQELRVKGMSFFWWLPCFEMLLWEYVFLTEAQVSKRVTDNKQDCSMCHGEEVVCENTCTQ